MSRLPPLQPETMTEAQRAVHEEIRSGPHGKVVGPYPAWLNSPELARRARALSEFIRFDSSLPAHLLELAILITGRHWKAEFEYYAHAKLAAKAGLEASIIAAIAAGRRPEFTAPEPEAVYALCTELFETNRVSDECYQQAVDRFGVPAVVELIGTIGYYSMVCMTLNTFQVGLPPGESSPFPD